MASMDQHKIISSSPNLLVVFDFDWTLLIDRNSDMYVFETFAPEYTPSVVRKLQVENNFDWSQVMTYLLNILHRRGVTKEQIIELMHSCPLQPKIVDTLRLLNQHQCELKIVSDANIIFIETILNGSKVRDLFSEIITNSAHWDSNGRLLVEGYHNSRNPHPCQNCDKNLCKGTIILRFVNSGRYRRVVYVGDGKNDFCPATKLRREDYLLCRKDWSLHVLIKQYPQDVQAQPIFWASADDIFNVIVDVLQKEGILDKRNVLGISQ
jgi:pyridoxal phosphate phosphatase PHOSPHO2